MPSLSRGGLPDGSRQMRLCEVGEPEERGRGGGGGGRGDNGSMTRRRTWGERFEKASLTKRGGQEGQEEKLQR